ncbi:hypothetical protein [Aurantiacibacter sp. MUD61]|uniref:hypothetical protein n=1 Tax=Aurantiacibacter sp. MUD61 TaxID=3009083 RepID=UPI0022F0D307|nr:hypothetical protein [Aurantiacibacter sp. MUD61]
MAALNGCTGVWRAEFSNLYGDRDEATHQHTMAVMRAEEIAFEADGTFTFSQPPEDLADQYDMKFDCQGNIDERKIEFVRVGEREARPPQGQIWSF